MRWKGRRQSTNVEDRRGQRSGGGMVMRGGGMGLLGIGLIIGIGLLFGANPAQLLEMVGGATTTQSSESTEPYKPSGPEEEQAAAFTKVVFADTEDVWTALFRDSGRTYRLPTLVLYSQVTRSACGLGQAAMGPFYCPPDQRVYIDLAFYDELRRRFGATGDFAQAYVIAHEVGHHVQNLLGIAEKVSRMQRGVGKVEANRLSVRMELQADFLAGVWAHHADKTKHILEKGDVQEAIGAASAIGDDKIQKKTQGRVVPDAFTHGTARQRVAWFTLGLETGDLSQMNTFDDVHFRRITPR